MTNRSSSTVQSVLIVGGGTAGWLAAVHLAKKLNPRHPDGVKITLIESDTIPTIGVGEGTVPAIRQSLQYLGISESDFIQQCDATFKQSIKFVNWMQPPRGKTHSYHHVFDYPLKRDIDLTPYYFMGDRRRSYVDSVSLQGKICDQGLGPKVMTQREFEGYTSYAYHLDATKFAGFLTKFGIEELGVTHLTGDVTDVNVGANGCIESLLTDRHGLLQADLYIDCTGFRSLLMGDKLGVPFVDKSDVLFVDTAVAAQLPYGADDALPCHTISTAGDAGWTWDIGLMNRRGAGYVYSSGHTTHDQAEQDFRDYARQTIGRKADDLSCRRIPMQVGYRQKFWVGNCVAIGLAQGFVEPLEATGLLMFDATARMLAEQFPRTQASMDVVASRFNSRINHAWDKVIDFIKCHYALSDRRDTQFWIDNCDPKSIPASLQNNLEHWKYQLPSAYDFDSRLEIFNLENYQYILGGMDVAVDLTGMQSVYTNADQAEADMKFIAAQADQLCGGLLPHRELVDRILTYGLQRV